MEALLGFYRTSWDMQENKDSLKGEKLIPKAIQWFGIYDNYVRGRSWFASVSSIPGTNASGIIITHSFSHERKNSQQPGHTRVCSCKGETCLSCSKCPFTPRTWHRLITKVNSSDFSYSTNRRCSEMTVLLIRIMLSCAFLRNIIQPQWPWEQHTYVHAVHSKLRFSSLVGNRGHPKSHSKKAGTFYPPVIRTGYSITPKTSGNNLCFILRSHR